MAHSVQTAVSHLTNLAKYLLECWANYTMWFTCVGMSLFIVPVHGIPTVNFQSRGVFCFFCALDFACVWVFQVVTTFVVRAFVKKAIL